MSDGPLPVTEADYARTVVHYVLHMIGRLHEYTCDDYADAITENGVLRHIVSELSAALAAREAADRDRATRSVSTQGPSNG